MMAAKWDTEEPTNQKGTTIRTHHLFESPNPIGGGELNKAEWPTLQPEGNSMSICYRKSHRRVRPTLQPEGNSMSNFIQNRTEEYGQHSSRKEIR